MAEILVKATSHVHPDPEQDRRGAHKKGDIITVQPDAHPWGAKEGPPRFVIVRCPEVSVQEIADRNEAWRYQITFETVASDLSIDGHRIRARNALTSATGKAAFTLAETEAFLTRWGATIHDNDAESVTFDVLIRDAIMSAAFWEGVSLADVTLTETEYVQAGGIHTIQADYSSHPTYLEKPASFSKAVASTVRSKGGEIVEQSAGTITFTVTRSTVSDRFREDVEQRLGTYQRHRYHFAEADVDWALAEGGIVDVTLAQLGNRVLDRLNE